MSARPPAQPNLSLSNGLACLLRLAGSPEPVGSRQLARELGLEHTRVNRLLGTLAHLGLAWRTPERKYTVGPGINILAAMSLRRSALLRAALPRIHDFQSATRCAAAFGMLWERRVCYLYHGEPGRDPTAAITGRDLFPAEVSSIGKVLLAELGDGEVRKLYGGRPEAVPGLLAELAEVRRRSFAVYEGHSIAVAVGRPALAGLAAMSVPPDDHGGILRHLKQTAADIEADLEKQS